MKGFVPTPVNVVDLMVEKLFAGAPPSSENTLLDPGCGEGEFIHGVLRWCRRNQRPAPRIVGIDSNPVHAASTRRRFEGVKGVEIRPGDFLVASTERFDYIVGNPPYVSIGGLSEVERVAYRSRYRTAVGRFDLYLLFFEEALRQLAEYGRLVFVTPEKYLYVDTARPLRRMLADRGVMELHFLDERSFGDLVTYPLVTVVGDTSDSLTRVIDRRGGNARLRLRSDSAPWMGDLNGHVTAENAPVLADACTRISCGVATGADQVFVLRSEAIPKDLMQFSRPTIAGREIRGPNEFAVHHHILLPYTATGTLIDEAQLASLGDYLRQPAHRERLMRRSCAVRKPWYSFHETPPLTDLLRPKLLCKDITRDAFFVVDRTGDIVPRHSVYYLIPADPASLDELADYLNSGPAGTWLRAHCQRAANGYLRLQSAVLKRLPLEYGVGGAMGPRGQGTLALKSA